MKKTNLDVSFKFRAPGVLAVAINEAAGKRGMSVSEYLRSIAREHVGLN